MVKLCRAWITKDLNGCDMDDEMDSYLSRSLKNWAARRQPPPHGKEHLLRAIVAPRWRSATAKRLAGSPQPPREFTPSGETVYLPGIMMRGSFTLSLAWPVHIGSLINLAQ
jgi:hypothetical protein